MEKKLLHNLTTIQLSAKTEKTKRLVKALRLSLLDLNKN